MCIICGGRIEDGKPTPSDGVAFDCVNHGVYAITRSALPRFLQMDAPAQEAALDRAKLFAANRNNELLITPLDL